jgi:hypothetical protein
MKKILMLVWVLIVACPVCFGQTNHSSVAATRLIHPGALKPSAQPARNSPVVSMEQNDPSPLAHFEDDYASDSSDQTSQRPPQSETGIISRIGQQGLLTPQANIAGPVRPKIIHMRHMQIYSSVVTAVARKNPLCLLDATFLNISF